MVLTDHDLRKWDYPQHTQAKHAILEKYIRAWMSVFSKTPIQGSRGRYLTIVDGFAGRGRYTDGSHGSPVIFHREAAKFVKWCWVSEISLFLVEADKENCANLRGVVDEQGQRDGLNIDTRCGKFAAEAPDIIRRLRDDPQPSFWFIDPFGFAGVPMRLIGDILAIARAEVFITFMVRDVNRFLDNPQHQSAIAELLDFNDAGLDAAIREVKSAGAKRAQALRAIFARRLKEVGGAVYVWSFRVAVDGPDDTIYYLIHGSTNIKAFREMKDATKEASGGTFAFLGKDDFAGRSQAMFAEMDADILKPTLLEVFRGSRVAWEDLRDAAYPDDRFYPFIEKDFRAAINALWRDGAIQKIPVTSATERGLNGKDILVFPDVPPEPIASVVEPQQLGLDMFR